MGEASSVSSLLVSSKSRHYAVTRKSELGLLFHVVPFVLYFALSTRGYELGRTPRVVPICVLRESRLISCDKQASRLYSMETATRSVLLVVALSPGRQSSVYHARWSVAYLPPGG